MGSTPLMNSHKRKMTISMIVGVGLCSTRCGRFSGGVEPRPYIQLLMSFLYKLVMGT